MRSPLHYVVTSWKDGERNNSLISPDPPRPTFTSLSTSLGLGALDRKRERRRDIVDLVSRCFNTYDMQRVQRAVLK